MNHCKTFQQVAALTLVAATLWPAPGAAQAPEPAPEPVPISWTSVRFATLFMDLTRMYPDNWGGSGALMAVELSHRRPNGLILEGISQLLFNIEYRSVSLAARVGYSMPLHGPMEAGSATRGFLVGLLGYRYFVDGIPEGEYDYLWDHHTVQAGFAYDLSIGERNAFAFRAYGVLDQPFSSRPQDDSPYYRELGDEPYRAGFQFGISLGMAFGR